MYVIFAAVNYNFLVAAPILTRLKTAAENTLNREKVFRNTAVHSTHHQERLFH